MPGTAPENAAAALEQAATLAAPPEGFDAAAYRNLVRAYYRHVLPEEIAGRSAADLDGAVRSHLALADERPQGTVQVRLHTPEVASDGWAAAGRSVIEIVGDDMPFLVDSVAAELTRSDCSIGLLAHPQIEVCRDISGALQALASSGADAPRTAESWIHIEVNRITEPDEAAAICEGLRRVLGDVRDAVEDWHKMGDAAFRAADDLLGEEGVPGRGTDPDRAEAWELLRWLADNHFTFLGYREYDLVSTGGRDSLVGVPGTGLGILRADRAVSSSFEALPPELRARARDPRPLIVTKSTSRSTVHRPAYLDYIGVKRFGEDGTVIGERRFLGLFSRSAYTESVARIPVLRRKMDDLYAVTGFSPASHSGRDLLEAVETYPRDELFQTPVPELAEVLLAVLHLKERRALRLFLRTDTYGRFVSALVYLPRDRYNTENRLRMQEILAGELHGVSVEYTSRVTESVLARLHFVVRIDPDLPAGHWPTPDGAHIEALLMAATRSWREALAEALAEQHPPQEVERLTERYAEAFPAGYREANSARDAVADLTRLELLPAGESFSVRLHARPDDAPGRGRFTLYRRGPAVSLSQVLPILSNMGVEVTDEQPYQISRAGNDRHSTCPGEDELWIYDFGLRVDQAALARDTDKVRADFQETFTAVVDGRAESDTFNRLVLAGMTWRQVSIVRAYARYLRQAGSTFGQDYVEQVVTGHAPIARALVRLFETRFDPALGAADADGRGELVDALTEELAGALDAVESLDADRILRSFLALISATLRTNYYGAGPGEVPAAMAVKLDPRQVPDLPAPRPRYEIWVYSPRMEGVHLRFGAVARGGLRWSDRREDFRTEILGLVKAQMVKNAVIVPVGAKGGFVLKRPPAPTGAADADREALAAEGVACYRSFIGALLDVTDNMIKGQIDPPARVVRHDSDDAYLVVAADKGTARFSDIANAISVERGFWLGDAFASGGSVGYDHKAMGITARGAWESVKRHFRERGIDCQAEDFTCVGIGDMSGDVFGNGMLLSRHIRLVAAFDHRHVFLDPDPDAAASYAERERLFKLPRSSWADYDTAALSAGGGIHPRTAKSIPIPAQVRARLGLPDAVGALTPNELIRAILTAEVDLLWNGGIGTYVKAAGETHAEVGDKANDAIRINGAQLRTACVGEGGNLGMTQRGRIEYARTVVRAESAATGRVNTDAIDNSAGVATSDREVNIKILLAGALAAGDLDEADRGALLASMTEEVAHLVLVDNYGQNLALAASTSHAPALLHAHERFIQALEADGLLDRELEFLPSAKEVAARAAEGHGLTAPELAVLLAYAKITLSHRLLASDLPDSPALADDLRAYFPTALRDRFAGAIADHPLRREILATSVVNSVVNHAGITFVHRLHEETGADEVDIVRARLVARDVFDLTGFRIAVDRLDNVVAAEVQTRMRLQARRLGERTTRWLLHKRRPPLDVDAEIAFFADRAAQVLALLPKVTRGADADALAAAREELVAAGVPHDLAERTAAMDIAYAVLDIVEVSQACGAALTEVAEVYFLLADRVAISELLAKVNALPRDDRWRTMARSSLREDLFATQAALTMDVLSADLPPGAATATPEQRFDAWRDSSAEAVAQVRHVFADTVDTDDPDLAMVSVAMRSLRGLRADSRSDVPSYSADRY